MLEVERVWSRASQRPEYTGKKLAKDMVYQVIVQSFQLASQVVSQATPVTFSAGAIVFGIQAGADINAIVGTTIYRPGLDLFSATMTYQQGRAVVTAAAIGSSLFGVEGNMMPGFELYFLAQQSIIYTVTNRTTSTINVDIAHHALVPLSA